MKKNQKPLELLNRRITSSSKEGDWILDRFVGSGTSGVVCSILNRKFIGIDWNKDYLDLAVKRFQDKKKNELLFNPKIENQITRFI